MPRIKTDILCNGKVFLRDTVILIHEWQDHIAGSFRLPAGHAGIGLKQPFAIRVNDNRSVSFNIVRFTPYKDYVDVGFVIKEEIAFTDFVHLEDI